MSSPKERVQVLHAESASLKEYLGGLSTADWARPSACEGWSVADVVAHLASALQSYTINLTRGLKGDAAPPEDRTPSDAWDRISPADRKRRAQDAAQRTISYRESLGDQLLPTFHLAIDGFNQLLRGLKAEDWGKMCYHPRGVIPAQTLVSYAILEVGMHKWDIQSRLETAAHLSKESLQTLIEHFPEYIHWAFLRDSGLGGPTSYHFQLKGAVSDEKDILIDNGRVCIIGTDDTATNAKLQCDAEVFLLLMCGRIKFAQAVADGQLVAEDSSRPVREFGQWLQEV